MLERPIFFSLLFPASSVFWWFFEYLNRFVQNWYYVGPQVTPTEYLIYASLSFSTVLPAVLSTREFLLTFPSLNRAFESYIRVGWVNRRALGLVLIMISGASLFFIGIYPNHLFSMLWTAPLFMIVGFQMIAGEPHVFSRLLHGDWRELIAASFGALVCGWFWEMWNYWSLTKWEYSVPYVSRFHIFEMPLLGYAGYLPFGLECVAVAGLLESLISHPKNAYLKEALIKA